MVTFLFENLDVRVTQKIGHVVRHVRRSSGIRLPAYELSLVEYRIPLASLDTSSTIPQPNYCLFHQILGVAFFQFARSLFKIFEQQFVWDHFFISPPPTPLKNLVELGCVFWKLGDLACIYFSKLQLSFHHYRETRMLLHAKWFNSQNRQHNSTKCWVKMKK